MQRYETGGIKNLPLDKLSILANALKCDPAYLMGWTDNPDGVSENTQIEDILRTHPELIGLREKLMQLSPDQLDKVESYLDFILSQESDRPAPAPAVKDEEPKEELKKAAKIIPMGEIDQAAEEARRSTDPDRPETFVHFVAKGGKEGYIPLTKEQGDKIAEEAQKSLDNKNKDDIKGLF